MNPTAPQTDPFEAAVQDTRLFRDATLAPADAAVIRAVAADPDDEWAWARLTGWLTDNGHADEAEAAQLFWPVIADSIRSGRPLAEVMRLVRRHAPAIVRLAARLNP